ncbi:hypothetical protein X274_01695 [Marinitoga sp. 1155]|nr:hypothetical protein X274_01695 [Marinitoga sp. 1155]
MSEFNLERGNPENKVKNKPEERKGDKKVENKYEK